MQNLIYIRRRKRIFLPPGGDSLLPLPYVAALSRNLEPLGFVLSPALMEACRALDLHQLSVLHGFLTYHLERAMGADRKYFPMYPNFPDEVMEASTAVLYFNAIVHYRSNGKVIPRTEVNERLPLLEDTTPTVIDLGSIEEFEGLFGRIASSNTSLSIQDREDLSWFVQHYGDSIERLLPERVPQKENAAILASLLLKHTQHGEEFASRFVKTATDVLRLAVAMCLTGDVSLAKPTRFRRFKRSERRILLALIERHEHAVEDMLAWKERWKRLGERLHPGEFAKRFPRTAEAFAMTRNDAPNPAFNSQVETALEKRDGETALALLKTRPGFLARRLDHLLRLESWNAEAILSAFAGVASKISTPVLLQVRHHFAMRTQPKSLRVFFPKGDVAKSYAIQNRLPKLHGAVCRHLVETCESAMLDRFKELAPLGSCFLDESLKDYPIPFAVRSASKSLRTVPRGSRLDIPDCKTLRFFVWWMNGKHRTDIDLSAALLSEEFRLIDHLAYYNLKGFGGCHSGDIVDAPEGASEFIDVNLDKLLHKKIRYIVMVVTSYTTQPFVDLPECFAGWMARTHADSGEIYEPRTLQDRLDLASESQIAIPVVFDIQENKAIWCDMALRSTPRFHINLHTNLRGIELSLMSMVKLSKPNLYDLLCLHIQARGTVAPSEAEATTVFSVQAETPYRLDLIASEYMA